MIRRIIYIAFLVNLSIISTYAQSAIQELTKSLIDTNNSKYEQAFGIYTWLTNNIKLDVKAINNGEYSSGLPEQTLKKGKGLAEDIATLYEAMCRTIDIEAYTISGYSKNYFYNKNIPFLRSNHHWTILHINDEWIHVDPSWGSGSINARYTGTQKALYAVFRLAYAKKKTYFTQQPSDEFFDVPITYLEEKQYPLDPKWLLSKNPLSFKAFENDTLSDKTDYPFFKEEIEKIRNKNSDYVLQLEGINGNKYNKNNYFDLANGYYIRALQYDLDRTINEKNYYQFEKYFYEYTTIVDAIEKHKILTDSVYRARKNYLREVARDQKRLTGRIKSKAKKAQDRFRSGQKSIVGKSSSYKKKMTGYQVNIGRTEIKKIPLVLKKELLYTDTNQYNQLVNELAALEEQVPEFLVPLDSLIYVVDNFSNIDAQINDSIARANIVFKKNIEILGNMVLQGKEENIIDYVDSLKTIYKEIEDFLDDKKTAKSDLQNTGRAYYKNAGELQKNLKKQMGLYTKLHKITENADTLLIAYNATIDKLIASYRHAISFTSKLKNHNEIQSDISELNRDALKEQKKSIARENKFFLAWYENHTAREKEVYEREKVIIKTIRSSSLRNQKTLEMKLNKFAQQQTSF